MSAFIVSTDTINLIVTACDRYGVSVYIPRTMETVPDGLTRDNSYSARTNQRIFGQILIDENAKSVNHRYRQSDAPERYTHKHIDLDWASAGVPVAHLILGSLRCYDYQACETDDYSDSLAKQIIERLQSAVIRGLTEDAPWGWTKDWTLERRAEVRAKIASDMAGVR